MKRSPLRDVLETAARRVGWEKSRGSAQASRGVGLACGTEKGSYVAACVEVETILLNRIDLPSAGAGETPMIAIPPAIANAAYHGCNVRIRSLPIRASALLSD